MGAPDWDGPSWITPGQISRVLLKRAQDRLLERLVREQLRDLSQAPNPAFPRLLYLLPLTLRGRER